MNITRTMTAFVGTVIAVTAIHLYPAAAQQGSGGADPRTVKEAPSNGSVRTELDRWFGKLNDQIKQTEELVNRLRSTALKTPEDTAKEVKNAQNLLSGLADKLRPEGDVATQLEAMRGTALKHRKRVAEMLPTEIEEGERDRILGVWDQVLHDTDEGAAMMVKMHKMVLGSVEHLRLRQTAISELLLAEQYATAVDALKRWFGELQETVKGLRDAFQTARPSN